MIEVIISLLNKDTVDWTQDTDHECWAVGFMPQGEESPSVQAKGVNLG